MEVLGGKQLFRIQLQKLQHSRLVFQRQDKIFRKSSYKSFGDRKLSTICCQHSEAENVQRRNANYKPNKWNYGTLQSISSTYDDKIYETEAKRLKDEISCILKEVEDPVTKLEIIDGINKLALSHNFEKDLKETLIEMESTVKIHSSGGDDFHATAMYYRILRHHGYDVSRDVFLPFMNETGKFTKSRVKVEQFDQYHLAMKGEYQVIDRAQEGCDDNDIKYAKQGLSSSSWNVDWFNVKKQFHAKDRKKNAKLLHLARLNFNMIQAQHQTELKDIIRWWRNLGLTEPETMNFARDRLVESFLWAVGVAYEPQHGNLRKWLTKAIMFILIIDDVYDIYGSMEELEQFTAAVERWDLSQIQQLPDAMRRCFRVLYDFTNDIDHENQNEKGFDTVLPYLQEVWTGFCKALLMEAKWYHTGYTPCLDEYLENGWISSSGPLLAIYILLGIAQETKDVDKILVDGKEIIYHASIIIRLCNDQGTSTAELERGDAPSSILCHMRERNVTEEAARNRISNMIFYSWNKIEDLYINSSDQHKPLLKYVINTARVAYFTYEKGDWFGDQDGEARTQVMSCLLEPL